MFLDHVGMELTTLRLRPHRQMPVVHRVWSIPQILCLNPNGRGRGGNGQLTSRLI